MTLPLPEWAIQKVSPSMPSLTMENVLVGFLPYGGGVRAVVSDGDSIIFVDDDHVGRMLAEIVGAGGRRKIEDGNAPNVVLERGDPVDDFIVSNTVLDYGTSASLTYDEHFSIANSKTTLNMGSTRSENVIDNDETRAFLIGLKLDMGEHTTHDVTMTNTYLAYAIERIVSAHSFRDTKPGYVDEFLREGPEVTVLPNYVIRFSVRGSDSYSVLDLSKRAVETIKWIVQFELEVDVDGMIPCTVNEGHFLGSLLVNVLGLDEGSNAVCLIRPNGIDVLVGDRAYSIDTIEVMEAVILGFREVA